MVPFICMAPPDVLWVPLASYVLVPLLFVMVPLDVLWVQDQNNQAITEKAKLNKMKIALKKRLMKI